MLVNLVQRMSGALLLGIVLLASSTGIAALTPTSAQEPALDLAAMALDQSDLPPEYHLKRFDDEGYTPGHRLAAIQFGDRISRQTLEPLGIVQFYSSIFFTDDESRSIYVYLTEYEDEAAVQAGFDFFEDEAALPGGPAESEDQPGPIAGDSPKEMTVGSDAADSPPTHFLDATFRVGRILAGVTVSSNGEAPATDLVETLANALAERIAVVLRGGTPAGVDPAMQQLSLKLFATWPWPGNSLEGYKNAEEFLGADGGLPEFADDYLGGYARFASAGSVDRDVQHEPPYIDLVVVEFAAPEAALGVLEASGELPTLHYGNPLSRTPVADPAIDGADAAKAFVLHRDPLEGVAGSFELTGYNVVFVAGTRLVTISILSDAFDTGLRSEDLEATVLDLAAQQLTCLGQEADCGQPEVPSPLSGIGMPATPAALS
jgi:hypothetical protein